MRRRWLGALLVLCLAPAAAAGLKVVGEGEQRRFDPGGFPPDMREKYALAEVKCANPSTGCHAFGRLVEAVVTGVGPVSKLPFDKEAAKLYGVKMMRKPDSEMTKKETKAVVELMYFLLDEVRRK